MNNISRSLMLITRSNHERISKIEKKHKRELQVRVIGSKFRTADIVNWKCVILLNNIFDDRKKQCFVTCEHTSWLVWNFNMVRQKKLFYTISMYSIYMYLNWFITNCIMQSLYNEHSHPYKSFQKRRHYTSLKSSPFLQMYILLISQGKEHRLF